MYSRKTSPEAKWWNSDVLSPYPGRAVLFVGAGISIDAPTRLPSGAVLTQGIIEHVLDSETAKEVLDTFKKVQHLVGRQLPRLEHILGAVCDPVGLSESFMGGNPRDLLLLFEHCTPNPTHHLIADFLVSTKSWAITTNFDDCIEQASNWRIPVHVLRHDLDKVQVVHGPSDSDWGLVKLHGTIEHGSEELLTTLRDLVPGLHPEYRRLLDRIFDTNRMVIVAGYSGSDHFDVNDYLRERMRIRNKPDLLWIEHSTKVRKREYPDWHQDALTPRHSWSEAFARTLIEWGPTHQILTTLIAWNSPSSATTPSISSPITTEELARSLECLFTPTRAYRHLIGARIAAGVGLAQLATEELAYIRQYTWDDNLAPESLAKVLTLEGYVSAANALLIQAKGKLGSAALLQRASLWRKSGRWWRSLLLFTRAAIQSRGSPNIKNIALLGCLESFLDAIESGQRWFIFRSWPMRILCRIGCSVFANSIDITSYKTRDVTVSARAEMIWLRCWVLLDDDIEALFENGTLWKLVAEHGIPQGQSVKGDEIGFYGTLWKLVAGHASPDEWAVRDVYPTSLGTATEEDDLVELIPIGFPGIYLTSLSTAREQDDLSEMIRLRLEFVRIMTSAVRRYRVNKWLLMVLRRGEDEYLFPFQSRLERLDVPIIFKRLNEAEELARALDVLNLRVAVAKGWLAADTALGGLGSWQPQRLYLGSHFRTCTVSFTDDKGKRHSTEVQDAFELHHACSVALRHFLRSGFSESLFRPQTVLTVYATEPATEHTVSVGEVRSWLITESSSFYYRGNKRATLKQLLNMDEPGINSDTEFQN